MPVEPLTPQSGASVGPEDSGAPSGGTADPGLVKVPSFVFLTGKKGSGKSFLAESLWLSYGGDRLTIDPTGDVAKKLGGRETFRVIHHGGPAPVNWPKRDDEKRATVIYVPNRRDPNWLGHVDSWIGLADYQGKTCIWIDEVGLVTGANNCPPNFADTLHTGRHRVTSLVMCGPRPMKIDPLVLGQSDIIYVFDLPQPQDRRRIAEAAGIAPDTIDAGVRALGPFEHLRIDCGARSDDPNRILHMEPIPG